MQQEANSRRGTLVYGLAGQYMTKMMTGHAAKVAHRHLGLALSDGVSTPGLGKVDYQALRVCEVHGPAIDSGIQVGDYVTRIEQWKVDRLKALEPVLRMVQLKKEVLISYMRRAEPIDDQEEGGASGRGVPTYHRTPRSRPGHSPRTPRPNLELLDMQYMTAFIKPIWEARPRPPPKRKSVVKTFLPG
eukprot:gene19721-993_t